MTVRGCFERYDESSSFILATALICDVTTGIDQYLLHHDKL